MAKNDVIARLKADTSQWESGLNKAGRSLQQFERQNLSMSGAVDKGMKSLLRSASQYVGWGAAVAGAMKVAGDAFMSSERNVDAWGQTLEASQSLYSGFVHALNNGDLSGFLKNIDNIVDAARAAYNALDELQTKSTIISPQQAKLQTLMLQQREIIRKNGRDSDAGKAAMQELSRLEGQMKGAYAETARLNRNAFVTKVKDKAAESGITLTNEMWRSFSDPRAYDSLMRKANGGSANELVTKSNGMGGTSVHFEDTRNSAQKFIDAFTDEFRQEVSQYLSAEWQAKGAAFQTGITNARYTGTGSNGSGTTSSKTFSSSFSAGSFFQGAGFGDQSLLDAIFAKNTQLKAQDRSLGLGSGTSQAIEQQIQDLVSTIEIEPLTIMVTPELDKKGTNEILNDITKSSRTLTDNWSMAANAISQVGGALSGIENPALNVATAIAQTVATIGLSYAENLSSDKTTKGNIWAFIAASAASAISLATTIASIKKSVEYHADGGIVGMSALSRGTDTVPAMLTPGEIVLNQAQSGNLASKLTSGFGGGQPYANGETIILGINNTFKRKGQGEIVTTNMLRQYIR